MARETPGPPCRSAHHSRRAARANPEVHRCEHVKSTRVDASRRCPFLFASSMSCQFTRSSVQHLLLLSNSKQISLSPRRDSILDCQLCLRSGRFLVADTAKHHLVRRLASVEQRRVSSCFLSSQMPVDDSRHARELTSIRTCPFIIARFVQICLTALTLRVLLVVMNERISPVFS